MQLLALSLFHIFLAKKKIKKNHLNLVKGKKESNIYMKMFGRDMAVTEWCFLGGKKLSLCDI